MTNHLQWAALVGCAVLCGCGGDNNTGGGLKGTIYYNDVSDGFVYKMNLADASMTKLIAGSYPTRTPEGSFIYVALPGLVESSDGVQVRTIVASNVDDASHANDDFSYPALSPDGKFIAYNTLSNLVYVCRRDNGQIVSQFTENPPGAGLVGWERPTWTPDGRIVVAGTIGTPGIFISDAAWTTLTRFDPMISQPYDAKVSPKGDLVAFEVNDHIYTLKLDGTGLKQMTMGNNEEKFPTWNPDGSAIAAYSGLDLWVVDADGTNLQMLSKGDPNVFFNFNTDEAFDWTN